MSDYIHVSDYIGLDPSLSTVKDRVYGAVLGEAIGDAIGHPIEDKWAADATKQVEGLLRENQFTDDTQMFCAIGEALLEAPPHLGEEAFMEALSRKFVEWRKAPLGGNHRAPGGNCMDAVRKLGTGKSWRETGGTSFKGNGTAMRSGVVGCMYWKSPKFAFRIGCLTAVPTHNNLEAILAAGMVSFLVATQIKGGIPFSAAVAEGILLCSKFDNPFLVPLYPKEVKLGFAYEDQNPWGVCADFGAAYILGTISDISIPFALSKLQDNAIIVNDGAARPAVAEAIFFNSLFGDEGYEGIVLNAANNSDDTDTIAAISGTIAGARFGQEQIHRNWRNGIELSDYLCNLAERLFTVGETVDANILQPKDAVNMVDSEVAEDLMSSVSITDNGEVFDGDDDVLLEGDEVTVSSEDDEEYEVEF